MSAEETSTGPELGTPLAVDDHNALLSPERWKRRVAVWGGAIAVALATIVFARGTDACYELFTRMLEHSRYWPFLVTPLGFGLLAWRAQGTALKQSGAHKRSIIAPLSVFLNSSTNL